MDIQIKKLNANAKLPRYGSQFAAGADLYACLENDVAIGAGETKIIPTGFAMALPVGYAGFIYARSGLATKSGLAPANKVGVVDCDYRGEVMVALYNHSSLTQTVKCGDRIAQLVVAPYAAAVFTECESLSETKRGAGGFGSTGENEKMRRNAPYFLRETQIFC